MKEAISVHYERNLKHFSKTELKIFYIVNETENICFTKLNNIFLIWWTELKTSFLKFNNFFL